MKTLIIIFLTIPTLLGKAQNVKKQLNQIVASRPLIGIIYNSEKEIKEFKGYKYMGGGLLDYTYAKTPTVNYALGQMYKPGKLLLILSKANKDTTKGKWTLIDTVSVKQNIYNGKYSLIMEGCSVNNKRDNLVGSASKSMME